MLLFIIHRITRGQVLAAYYSEVVGTYKKVSEYLESGVAIASGKSLETLRLFPSRFSPCSTCEQTFYEAIQKCTLHSTGPNNQPPGTRIIVWFAIRELTSLRTPPPGALCPPVPPIRRNLAGSTTAGTTAEACRRWGAVQASAPRSVCVRKVWSCLSCCGPSLYTVI